MSDLDVLIRVYEGRDLEVLRDLTVASFGSVAVDEMLEERFGVWNGRDWKARKADHIDEDVAANAAGCFVAECGGRVVGYVTTRVDRVNGIGRIPNLAQTPKLEATDRLEHWLLNASRSLDSILKDAAAADRKALSSQASSPLKHLELRNLGLAVAESMRGRGLGRRLIEHALGSFREEGMGLAKIETMASNPIGQKLYPSCGFEEVGRQVHYAMRL